MGQNVVVLFARWDLDCVRSHQYVSCCYMLIFERVFFPSAASDSILQVSNNLLKLELMLVLRVRYLVEKSFKTPHSLYVACCVEPHHILVIISSQDFLLQSVVPSSISQRDSSLTLSCSSEMLNICFIIVCMYERVCKCVEKVGERNHYI